MQQTLITAKRKVVGSKNLNDGADLVIDEQELIKAGKKNLLTLLQEKVIGLNYRLAGNGNYSLSVVRNPIKLVIDGIPTNLKNYPFDASLALVNYSAEDIKGIEVMRNPRYSNAYNFAYLTPEELLATKMGREPIWVEVTTRGNYGPFGGKRSSLYLYRPLAPQPIKTFYSPRYTSNAAGTGFSDIRSTIYWEPDMVTDENGCAMVSFYAADNAGSYTVLVEGADMDGRVGTAVHTITINSAAKK